MERVLACALPPVEFKEHWADAIAGYPVSWLAGKQV